VIWRSGDRNTLPLIHGKPGQVPLMTLIAIIRILMSRRQL